MEIGNGGGGLTIEQIKADSAIADSLSKKHTNALIEHGHGQAAITGLESALTGKADTGHGHSQLHDGAAQDTAIAGKTTLSAVKADTDVADALSKKHSNNLDHSNSQDHSNAADHDGGAQNTAIAGKVTANGAITGAQKTKITYDAKGLVTSGADATTADIADSSDKRYCTDAQKTVIQNTSGSNSGDSSGHSGLEVTSNKGAASGYCGLSASQKVAIGNLPTGATVNDVCIGNDARLSDARQLAAGTDKTKLDGIATGAVADHVNIANKGTNTHSQIDTFVSSKNAAGGLAAIGYAALANDTLPQALATNLVTKLTVTADRTLTTTVPPAGVRCAIIILTSGTSSRTITFGSGFKPTGTLATGTTSARVFVINWISDGTNLYEAGRTAAMVA